MQVSWYTVSLLLSALVSVSVALFVWRRRSVPAGRELALLLAAVAYWAFFQWLEASSTTRLAKMVWTAINYPGNMFAPVFFLFFALRFAQQDRWLGSRKAWLLWIIPVISVGMAATSGLQKLLWTHVDLTQTSVGVIAVYGHGPWYWVEVVYSWGLILWGVSAVAGAAWRLPNPYRGQARMIVFAAVAPLVGQFVYAFSQAAIQGLDVTPITFTLTSLLVAAALLRYQMLDLRPIASGVLYEGVRDAMVAVDHRDRVVDINTPACLLLGIANGNAIGRSAAEVFQSMPRLVECLGSEGPTHREIEIERDGAKCYFDVRIWPLHDRRERPLGKLVNLHDITELRTAQDELVRINAELDGYAHTVSHDLKGPLTSIMLANQALERLLDGDETPARNEKINQVLHMMLNSTEKANAHINCLLALAEAGQNPAIVEEVNLNAIVHRILEEHRGDIDDHRAGVQIDDLGFLHADPTHIYQLLANLIGNAFDHNTRLDLDIEVRRLEDREGAHRFLIRDNGQGIAKGDLQRIFEPFYKAGATGTGIGLATARRIVDVYGGEIFAYNDHGACFEFSLYDWPQEAGRALPEDAPSTSPSASPPPSAPAASAQSHSEEQCGASAGDGAKRNRKPRLRVSGSPLSATSRNPSAPGRPGQ